MLHGGRDRRHAPEGGAVNTRCRLEVRRQHDGDAEARIVRDPGGDLSPVRDSRRSRCRRRIGGLTVVDGEERRPIVLDRDEPLSRGNENAVQVRVDG